MTYVRFGGWNLMRILYVSHVKCSKLDVWEARVRQAPVGYEHEDCAHNLVCLPLVIYCSLLPAFLVVAFRFLPPIWSVFACCFCLVIIASQWIQLHSLFDSAI